MSEDSDADYERDQEGSDCGSNYIITNIQVSHGRAGASCGRARAKNSSETLMHKQGTKGSSEGRTKKRSPYHTNSVLFHTAPPSSVYLQSIFANIPFSQNAMANLRLKSTSIVTQYLKRTSTARTTASVKSGPTYGTTGIPQANGGSGCDRHIPTPSHGRRRLW